MNLDRIIARAVPPPERAGGPFAPVETDPAIRRHRQEQMAQSFGSREQAEAHAESIGIHPDAWFARLDDVRLEGEEPPWATLFREIHAELRNHPSYAFEHVRKWAKQRLFSRWPRELARGPNAHSGFLDYLAQRLALPVQSLAFNEKAPGNRVHLEGTAGARRRIGLDFRPGDGGLVRLHRDHVGAGGARPATLLAGLYGLRRPGPFAAGGAGIGRSPRRRQLGGDPALRGAAAWCTSPRICGSRRPWARSPS